MNVGFAAMLAQTDLLSPSQRGVRDHFQTGGSMVAACMVVLVIASLVATAYAITRYTERPKANRHQNDTQALFGNLMKRLGVTCDQRNLLERVAQAQSLSNPSVLLLSPAVFEAGVHAWQTGRKTSPDAQAERNTAEVISLTRAALFPCDIPPQPLTL